MRVSIYHDFFFFRLISKSVPFLLKHKVSYLELERDLSLHGWVTSLFFLAVVCNFVMFSGRQVLFWRFHRLSRLHQRILTALMFQLLSFCFFCCFFFLFFSVNRLVFCIKSKKIFCVKISILVSFVFCH